MIAPDDIVKYVAAAGALVAAINSLRNSRRLGKVHVEINSRLTQLLDAKDEVMKAAVKSAAAEAHALGLQQGQAQATRTLDNK